MVDVRVCDLKGEPVTAPVRSCCMERHYGAVCPDGKVMCCVCFNRFDQEDLHRLVDGSREDVCCDCAVPEPSEGEAT